MTNYGFHTAMADEGIEVATTQVGDRYVIEELRERDWPFGGEQSGHIIWTDFAPTGDGIAAALLALTALDGRDLAEVEPFERLPQRLENLEIPDREALDGATALWDGGRDGVRRARGPRPRARAPVGHRARSCGSWSRRRARRSATRCWAPDRGGAERFE